MSDEQPIGYARGESRPAAEAIKRTALGALLAGGVCLFLGFSWNIDWPILDDKAAEEVWKQIDYVFRGSFMVIGAVFLVVAALAQTGMRASALLGAGVEGAFALLMLAVSIETILEQRASGGGFDASVILFGIMLIVGISAARHSWTLYKRTAPPSEADAA